jgi:hypothetical protein
MMAMKNVSDEREKRLKEEAILRAEEKVKNFKTIQLKDKYTTHMHL